MAKLNLKCRAVALSVLSALSMLITLLALWPLAVVAQVYVTPGKNGPVYSDKPQEGAKPVTLQPLNVMSSPKKKEGEKGAVTADAAAPEAKSDLPRAIPAAYRRFEIVFPENDGAVVANTAVFDVRVAVDPVLQLGEGHAFTVAINGRPVAQRFTATEFMIPPEFWGDTLPPPNQAVQLDAQIVDRNGKVLNTAAPIRFYLRYATGYGRQYPPLPPHPPRPLPPQPKPKPLPATPETPSTLPPIGSVSGPPVGGERVVKPAK